MIGDATTAVETTVRKVQRAIREVADDRPDDALNTLSFLLDWLELGSDEHGKQPINRRAS